MGFPRRLGRTRRWEVRNPLRQLERRRRRGFPPTCSGKEGIPCTPIWWGMGGCTRSFGRVTAIWRPSAAAGWGGGRFARTRFGRAGAGRCGTPIARELLPLSLLDRFAGEPRDRLVATLRFLGPITTASARGAMAF